MFLLDTNVVSEFRKLRSSTADPNVVVWATTQNTIDFFVSAITIMELEIGVQRLEKRNPTQGASLRKWMENQVLVDFADRILPVDFTVALRCAQLHVPTSAPFKDSLIAATALIHNLTVVTRNVADFANTGVRLINPWDRVQK